MVLLSSSCRYFRVDGWLTSICVNTWINRHKDILTATGRNEFYFFVCCFRFIFLDWLSWSALCFNTSYFFFGVQKMCQFFCLFSLVAKLFNPLKCCSFVLLVVTFVLAIWFPFEFFLFRLSLRTINNAKKKIFEKKNGFSCFRCLNAYNHFHSILFLGYINCT